MIEILSNRYQIQNVVGSGGMAIVYRAFDQKTNKIVAIKIPRPEYESDREFVRSFATEAQAAAKVSHPNIVKVLEVVSEKNTQYIVMEYVDGQTLKELIRKSGALKPNAAIRMVLLILSALDHAHKNGIVHRDIKPQNILVDKSGNIKVADFGIASIKNTSEYIRISGNEKNLAPGSVHYFSPEQARGEVGDEKSDLYSVGVVLYEMLTGQVPFDAANAIAVAVKHADEAPASMRTIKPNISKALDEIVMRALSKDARRRYQSADEMAKDLRKASLHPEGGFVHYPPTPEEEEARREERRRKRLQHKRRLLKFGAIVCAVLLIGIIAFGTWYFQNVYHTADVPYLLNLDVPQMRELLQERGLGLTVMEDYNEEIAAETAVSQSPQAGDRIKQGKNVQVNISLGTEWYVLDSLIGMTLDEAQAVLDDLQVPNIAVEVVLIDEPADTVVGQSLLPGNHSRREEIVLQISGEHVDMPMLMGLTQEGAQALLEAYGLKLGGIATGYSADVPAGIVMMQSVDANANVLLGTEIYLTVSQGQTPEYYPTSDFTMVVPLDDISVRIVLSAPSGKETEVFSDTMSSGTYVIPMSSTEKGTHTLYLYMDNVPVETLTMEFN